MLWLWLLLLLLLCWSDVLHKHVVVRDDRSQLGADEKLCHKRSEATTHTTTRTRRSEWPCVNHGRSLREELAFDQQPVCHTQQTPPLIAMHRLKRWLAWKRKSDILRRNDVESVQVHSCSRRFKAGSGDTCQWEMLQLLCQERQHMSRPQHNRTRRPVARHNTTQQSRQSATNCFKLEVSQQTTPRQLHCDANWCLTTCAKVRRKQTI